MKEKFEEKLPDFTPAKGSIKHKKKDAQGDQGEKEVSVGVAKIDMSEVLQEVKANRKLIESLIKEREKLEDQQSQILKTLSVVKDLLESRQHEQEPERKPCGDLIDLFVGFNEIP